MSPVESNKKTLGRAERISFPELELFDVPARVDTGARTSTIWISQALERSGVLEVVFFGPQNKLYSGSVVTFEEFEKTSVSSSTGQIQIRYKIRLLVQIKGKKIRAWFTLADRSTQVYPVLIGRNVLLGKFIVDVKKGQLLKDAEQRRTQELQAEVDKSEEEA